MKKWITGILVMLSVLYVAGCTRDADTAYTYYQVLKADGLNRTYQLNLPANYYTDETKRPLLIVLHGAGGKASQAARDYGFQSVADTAGFITVYPEGVQSNGPLALRTWNAGGCCHEATMNRIPDVNFIRLLITYLVDNWRVDARRIYIAGMSNGGMMAYRLACELSDKIAAAAVVSGTDYTAGCAPVRTVPLIHFHSALDTKVPPAGGTGLGGYYFPPVMDGLQKWVAYNHCNPAGEISDEAGYKRTVWKNQEDTAAIVYYLTSDGGHSWPGGRLPHARADQPSRALNATALIWAFFRDRHLP